MTLLTRALSFIPMHNNTANPIKMKGAVKEKDKKGTDTTVMLFNQVGNVGTPMASNNFNK